MTRLLSAIDADYKSAQKESWGYHKDILKDILHATGANNCDDAVMDANQSDDWDDIHYYAGYFRGLQSARDMLMDILSRN
jgi:hypothetical protein